MDIMDIRGCQGYPWSTSSPLMVGSMTSWTSEDVDTVVDRLNSGAKK